jgi:sec-independent protein translocase protein TatC
MPLDQDPHDYPEEKEMSFLDHLEELRWHVVRAVGAIIIFTIVGFIYVDWVFNQILLAPAKANFWTWRMLCKLGHAVDKVDLLCIQDIPLTLQSRYMTGQFTITIVSAFVLGLVLAFPYVIWEAWRFIKPGLRTTERKNTSGVVFSVSSLFALGISFGYYVIAPLMVYVMVNYRISDMIVNQFDVTSYVTTFVALVLGSGLLFQLPVVVFFLTKMGLLTPQFMRKYRKHAIIVILIIAAIITPPDPLSQTLISLPLYLLYEISIFISAVVVRRKKRDEEEELKNETSTT